MEIAEAFKEDIPVRFLEALNRHITEAYESGKRAVDDQGLGPDEAYNVLPLTRRGHVETALRRAAAECGLSIVTENTGYWRHVVVTCGRFRITQTTTLDTDSPLRKAAYKCGYANEQQLFLDLDFGDIESTPAHDDPHLYAIIIHRGPVLASEPDFMKIKFPKPELAGYHDGEVDLAIYAELPEAEHATAEEKIVDEAIPKLKQQRARGAG